MTQMSLLRGCLDPATVVCGLHTLLQLGNREQLNGWTGFYERANSPLVHIGTQAGLSLVLAFLQHLPSIFLFDPKSMDLFSKFHPIDSRAEEDRNDQQQQMRSRAGQCIGCLIASIPHFALATTIRLDKLSPDGLDENSFAILTMCLCRLVNDVCYLIPSEVLASSLFEPAACSINSLQHFCSFMGDLNPDMKASVRSVQGVYSSMGTEVGQSALLLQLLVSASCGTSNSDVAGAILSACRAVCKCFSDLETSAADAIVCRGLAWGMLTKYFPASR
jgi:hypothetical protein